MRLNDDAWEELFVKYNILDVIDVHGEFIISANQIKEYREPRLMTKFDHKINLPHIFKENGLSILPITRGNYMISTFSAYKELELQPVEAQRISIPSYLQSLIPQYLVSESIALNCANACGMLSDFLEDDNLVPTVSGRMGSGSFGFNIETSTGLKYISVQGAQIEIDAAYEGVNSLSLFEAKKDLSEDFLVRQLYYPYRVWSSKVSKPVKPIFFIFSNGIFDLFQYQFDDPMCYNSLSLVKQKRYVISTEICLSDIMNIVNTVPEVHEPEIPFPQANSMQRIINLIELLSIKPMTKDDITDEYAFDERQTNYYTDAGRYLGLIVKERNYNSDVVFRLSANGKILMGLGFKERQLFVVSRILEHRVFRDVLNQHLILGEMPSSNEIVQIMKNSNLHNISEESTFVRRASTVMRWVEWILSIIESYD